MNNTTAVNETNQTIWDVKDIADVQNLFSNTQELVSNLLISWDMIPEDVYFRLFVVVLGVLGLYQLFVTSSSKAGGLFRYVLMLVVVIVILIALNII
jgi:hypothetical protein